MTEPETQEVTITVPKPPKGWVIEIGRLPSDDNESHMLFNGDHWKGPFLGKSANDKHRILAFPAPKRKRLLTPSELAGKWIYWNNHDRSLVVAFNETHVWTGTANNGFKVAALHAEKCGYALTPTSERLPLEIEDDQ